MKIRERNDTLTADLTANLLVAFLGVLPQEVAHIQIPQREVNVWVTRVDS